MSQPNIIVVVLDSLRQDHVGTYGGNQGLTPSIDAFAAEPQVTVFDRAFPEALPTVPARMGLLTGQRSLTTRPWGPIPDEQMTLPERLRHDGYVTAMVTDNYHLHKPSMNYHKGFDSVQWIRGQEADPYRTAPASVDLDPYMKPEMEGSLNERLLEQYLRNTAKRNDEDEQEFFAAQVFREAIKWIERNGKHHPKFLLVDSFDPHEPWDPPAEYRGKHCDETYDGPDLIDPMYGETDWMTEAELSHAKGRYAEEITFVDNWFGKFIEALKTNGVYEETLITVVSDHGVQLGEHGKIGKPQDGLYREVVDIPMLVKLPSNLSINTPDRVDTPVQTHDLPATILDSCGLECETDALHSRSLLPILRGETTQVRDVAVTGYYNDRCRVVRDDRWSFHRNVKDGTNSLFNLQNDPHEECNVINKHPDVAQRLESAIVASLNGPKSGPMSADSVPTIQERYRNRKSSETDVPTVVSRRLRELGYID